MWITTTTGKYFYDPHTDGEVPVIGQDWILPSGDNLGRVQSIGVFRPQNGSYDQTAPF